MSRRLLPAVAAALACAFDLAAANNSQVHAWQDSIQLPTYLGEASASPQFAAYGEGFANYPYPLLSNLTNEKQDRVWRTLNLENEYLLCRILPDLGGHLYSCRDKRNNREMFYANPVIKPGDIGLRGAWAALGIESNFPVGHTRVSISPVDFALREESDGSGRAVLEDIDRVTGVRWRVEYILRPGSTLLEQRVTLSNPTAVRWPYSWWANAGIAFDDPEMRIVLPAHVVSTHTTPPELVPWPVMPEGKDGTILANHRNAGGWFAHGSREPFFAVYKPAFRSGVAHYADPDIVTGKKIWLWGSQQDEWVKRTLTDNFSSYVEMQAGRFEEQDTFQFLAPGQIVQFSEFWIPVCDMGGITRATRDVILNLQRRADTSPGPTVQIELSATHAIRKARLEVLSGNQKVFEGDIDLDPGKTYSKALPNPGDAPYTVQLVDAVGAILLRHVEGVYDAVAPDRVRLGSVPKPFLDGPETESNLLARASYHELQQRWKDAGADYSTAHKRFPANDDVAIAEGNFALTMNRAEAAVSTLAPVAAAKPVQILAVYDLGVAQAMLGQDAQARKTLSSVPPLSGLGNAAGIQLALLAARAKDDVAALSILKPLLSRRPEVTRAGELAEVLLRRSGHKAEASQLLDRLYAADPASTLLRAERTLMGSEDADLWKHLSLDGERVLDLVDDYLSVGCDQDALNLLSHQWPKPSSDDVMPGVIPTASHPLIFYYRAFLSARLGQDATEDLHSAAASSSRYVFPSRWSSLAVLESAVKANPSDAHARLLLGRLLLDQMKVDEAIAQWQAARKVNPTLPELDRELGRALVVLKKDEAGRKVLNEGLRLNPSDSELRDLLAHATQVSTPEPPPGQAKAPAPTPAPVGPAAPPARSSSPVEVATAAMLRAAAGHADDAAGMFNPAIFSAEKQPDAVRQAWIEVQLQRLLTRAHEGKCADAIGGLVQLGGEDTSLGFTLYGFGKFTRDAHFQFYSASIEADCQHEKDARKQWSRISRMTESLPSPEFAFPLLAQVRLEDNPHAPEIGGALEAVRAALAKADASSKPALLYVEAMLLQASGKAGEAAPLLQQAKDSGNTMVQYLSLTATTRPFGAK